MIQSQRIAQQDGVLVLHKPSGPTSNHCLRIVKRLGQAKIGHAGTLDPMASGVLLVLLGQATKLSGFLMGAGRKVYSATLQLGIETDTWDKEGTIVRECPWQDVTADAIQAVLESWQGTIEQQVPPYSAAKSNGKPLYSLARAGKDVPEKYKKVEILHTELLAIDFPFVRFRVSCSSGTYIRSLAHSLGKRVQCGATLTELIREYSHPFALTQAIDVQSLQDAPEALPNYVHSLTEALPDWPVIEIAASQEKLIRNGVALPCPAEMVSAVLANNGLAFVCVQQKPLALVNLVQEKGNMLLRVNRGLWHSSSTL